MIGLYINLASISLFIIPRTLLTLNVPIKSHSSLDINKNGGRTSISKGDRIILIANVRIRKKQPMTTSIHINMPSTSIAE